MRLTRFVGRRFVAGVISVAAFLFVMYLVIEALIPGDIVSPLRMGMTGQELEELRQQMGLDRALPIRFWSWFTAMVRGDLASAGFRSQGQTIFSAFPATLVVFVIGLSIAYSVGSWLGRRTAWSGGPVAGGLTLLGVLFYTIFPPFLAFVLDRLLTVRVRDLRISWGVDLLGNLWDDAVLSPNQVMMRMVLVIGVAWLLVGLTVRWSAQPGRRLSHLAKVTAATVLTVVGWRLLGISEFAFDILLDAALPILGFAVLSFGEFLLITQAGMATTMHEDFVLTARAKGLLERRIRDHHVARNAMLISFTRMTVSLPYLLTGLVIIETALNWQGVGTFMFNAIETQDMPVVMSGLAVIGAVTMLSRLILELVIASSDPRIVIVPEGAA